MTNSNVVTIENKPKKLPKADLWIVLIVSALAIFGTIMVFSASYYYAIEDYGSPYYYLKRHIVWIIGGFICMAVCSMIDYHFWIKLWVPFYIVGLLLLIAVKIPGIGTETYGAVRWIYIGPISLMPGEISKVPLLFALTGLYAKYKDNAKEFVKGIIPAAALTGAYALLIMLQPNMSTAFTLIFMMLGIMLIAGCRVWHLALSTSLAGAAGLAFIFMDKTGYRYNRYLSFLDPFADRLGAGWNAVQSLLAIGSGGLLGKGIGNSVQKNLYLPMPQNDFILAVIGEELGFVGVFLLMVVYMILLWRGSLVALKAKDFTGLLLAGGIVTLIGVQTLIHFAVVTSSMPPTGITLPFISYGGNATLIFMSLAGILLNISKQSK